MSTFERHQEVWVKASVIRPDTDADGDISVAVQGIVIWAQSSDVMAVGSIPPWMKLVTSIDLTHDDGSGWNENVYRLTGEGDS